MSRFLTCLAVEHDFRLVGLALMICIVGSSIALKLFQKAVGSPENCYAWLFLAGAASGTTVWTTHFLGMLAFIPSSSVGYEPVATLISWIVAVSTCSAGLIIAQFRRLPAAPECGGIFVGLGIGAMHFLGMSSLETGGGMTWDAPLVMIAFGFGTSASALSLSVAARSRQRFAMALAVAAFVTAVCGLHFIAMSAVNIVIDQMRIERASVIGNNIIALSVFIATMTIIGAGSAARLIVLNEARLAQKRVSALADAAVEGILILDGDHIIAANRSFELMSGYDLKTLAGLSVFPDLFCESARGENNGTQMQTVLNAFDGCWIPVEVTANISDEGQTIYAVRNLTAKVALRERIEYLAHFDTLTSLPNRQALIDHIEQVLAMVAPEDKVTVFGMDLDRFKQVNDLFGHAAGDQVLVHVTKAMRTVLRNGEFLARIGGDEFVAVQTNAVQPAASEDFCERMLKAASTPIQLLCGTIDVGLSIGIATYPVDGQTSAELLANADLAMYRAKRSSNSSFCFFVPEMDESMKRRVSLAHDLRDAAARDELQLFYQVQTSILSSEIVGYEVLLRWNHPRLGLVPPSDFIPIAEECGLITAIGTWVLERACQDAVGWSRPYRIAVNVSGVQFSTGDLPSTVHRVLLQTGLAASRLELEITETVFVANTERTLLILRQLKALGVTIAMDDFGTGYSSLSTLQAFPFDKIKIDRSFIARLATQSQARSIVRAILALGRSLEIPVLAEGIETNGDLVFLRDEGCDEAQGYLLGRPMPLEKIEELVATHGVERACA